MALLNPCMKFKIFLAKSILLKHYENGNKKFFSQLVPGPAKSRIYAEKRTKRGFTKKSLEIDDITISIQNNSFTSKVRFAGNLDNVQFQNLI